VPKPDLVRVLDGVRNSRKRFDAYYAIVADTMDMPMIGRSDKWWQAASLHQVWSKGDCWRVEQARPATRSIRDSMRRPNLRPTAPTRWHGGRIT